MPVPTTLEFQNDSDLKLVVMHKRVNDVILQRIDDLLDQYHAYKSHQAKRHQILTLAFLYFSTEVWLKKSEQLRTDVNSRRKPAVERLYRDVVSELSQLLGIEINMLPMWFEDVFGTGMVAHGFEVDMTQGMFPQIRAEYFTREQLEKCRLYFLSGAAYVKRAGMLKRFNSSLYSHGFNQPISENFSGYVLGRNGQFYCHEHRVGSGSDGGFFHSGYFAGEPIICAGEIHVVNGEIREINNNSGHYRPSTTSLYTAVRLLEARGVNLNHVRVQSWEAGWHSGRTFLDAFGPKYNLAPGMPANHAFSSRLNQ
ncbi:MAG: hypothetical protein KDA92_20550, partial [Planctomycetales bacterium]|nr:hypothetical protein [Planctomycetales bacterium]